MDSTPETTIKHKLFENLYTTQDLVLFYKEIDQLIAAIFTDGPSFEEQEKAILSPDKIFKIHDFLEKQRVHLNNPVEVKEALEKIKKEGETLPIVTLQLAFEPTRDILKNIHLWFLRRMEKTVLLEITLERQVLGGAFISFNGTYKDYTLKTKIDSFFEKRGIKI